MSLEASFVYTRYLNLKRMNCLPGGLVLVYPEGASGLRGFHNHITVYLEHGQQSYHIGKHIVIIDSVVDS